jgi:hypothetical protein
VKNVLNLMLVSAIAVSCVNLNGELNVQRPMSVNRKGGFLNLKKIRVNLDQGSYRAELTLKSNKNLSLELKMPNDQKDITIPIKSDSSLNVPTNGTIRIAGSSIDQPFNISGTINTTYSDSPSVSGYESCTYTRTEYRWERVCRDVNEGGHDRDHRDHREERCSDERRTVEVSTTGSQFVVSHTSTTNRNITAVLKDLDSKAEVATLNASGSESVRVVESTGICR